MNIHEHQAKEILKQFGINIPKGITIFSLAEIDQKFNNLKTKEVLFIDDSPHHIYGAKKLGIKTYHLKDDEEITTVFPDLVL